MLESSFEQCAIASKLVSEGELISAWKELKSGTLSNTVEIPGKLAEILVNRGVLNRWQAQQLLAGQSRFTLGAYRITNSIGHGGMGQVFKARHETIGTIVAIKVLPRVKATQAAIANFENEIKALSSLDHPNLVRAIDAGIDGNVNYLVTEYVPGPDLKKLVRSRGPLQLESAASIIIQAARGLHHAHLAGFVHRDVKPGNILVTMHGIAKLSDLGLASSQSQVGQPTKIVGTAGYISPDQSRNLTEPLPVWDVYSLGCTLYYAVTGQQPYPNGTVSEKVRQHRDPAIKPINPCLLNPLVSEEFADVIACMMAKNPAERIPTALEVIQFLSPWSDGSPKPVQVADVKSLSPSTSVSPPATAEEGGEKRDSSAPPNVLPALDITSSNAKGHRGIAGVQTIPGPPLLPGMESTPKPEKGKTSIVLTDLDFIDDSDESVEVDEDTRSSSGGVRKMFGSLLKRFVHKNGK